MSAEILARLNPKTSNMDQVGISTAEGLSQTDIAATLARLPKGPELMGWLVAYPDSQKQRTELKLYMLQKITDMVIKGNWGCPEPLFYTNMAIMAISEVISTRICQTCNGRGEVRRLELKVVCHKCEGTGKEVVTQRHRYEVLGISRVAWAIWKERYESVYRMVRGWDSHMKSHVREKLQKHAGA